MAPNARLHRSRLIGHLPGRSRRPGERCHARQAKLVPGLDPRRRRFLYFRSTAVVNLMPIEEVSADRQCCSNPRTTRARKI